MDRIPFTREGYEKIKKELERLINIERPKVIKEIEEARAHGDLSENAEYECAKEKQGQIEAKIRELSDVLARAEIIPSLKEKPERVQFGVKVKLFDVKEEKEVEYRIVGPYESAPEKGYISVLSPIGRALIGKEIGEVVKVKIPAGEKIFEIIDIEI